MYFLMYSRGWAEFDFDTFTLQSDGVVFLDLTKSENQLLENTDIQWHLLG